MDSQVVLTHSCVAPRRGSSEQRHVVLVTVLQADFGSSCKIHVIWTEETHLWSENLGSRLQGRLRDWRLTAHLGMRFMYWSMSC